MVDSNDRERIQEAQDELQKMVTGPWFQSTGSFRNDVTQVRDTLTPPTLCHTPIPHVLVTHNHLSPSLLAV